MTRKRLPTSELLPLPNNMFPKIISSSEYPNHDVSHIRLSWLGDDAGEIDVIEYFDGNSCDLNATT
jgi:hypothetical protein